MPVRPGRALRWQTMAANDAAPVSATALEPLMAIDDVAEVLGISERGVYRLVSRGELISVKVGARTLFDPADIRQFIAEQRRPTVKELRP